jgi:hypothetical protein
MFCEDLRKSYLITWMMLFLNQVPALVLDCEHDIDFNKDIEAKRL